ncbi:MAG: hypothetical protein AAFZ65_03575 [Planctomycetota bacterium]
MIGKTTARLWAALVAGMATSAALYSLGSWAAIEATFGAIGASPLELAPRVTEADLRELLARLSTEQVARYRDYQPYDVAFALANSIAVWAASRLALGPRRRRLALSLALSLFSCELLENLLIYSLLHDPARLAFLWPAAIATLAKQLCLAGALVAIVVGMGTRVFGRRGEGRSARLGAPAPSQ